jgi:hypothetical protein
LERQTIWDESAAGTLARLAQGNVFHHQKDAAGKKTVITAHERFMPMS